MLLQRVMSERQSKGLPRSAVKKRDPAKPPSLSKEIVVPPQCARSLCVVCIPAVWRVGDGILLKAPAQIATKPASIFSHFGH